MGFTYLSLRNHISRFAPNQSHMHSILAIPRGKSWPIRLWEKRRIFDWKRHIHSASRARRRWDTTSMWFVFNRLPVSFSLWPSRFRLRSERWHVEWNNYDQEPEELNSDRQLELRGSEEINEDFSLCDKSVWKFITDDRLSELFWVQSFIQFWKMLKDILDRVIDKVSSSR
jgi:hypothetical protein